MNAHLARTFALVALCAATAAHATTTQDGGAVAVDLGARPFDVTTTTTALLPSAPEASLEIAHLTIPDVQLGGVHYRPRSSGWGRHVDAQSVSQIHLGFFDPEGTPGSEFLLGIRGGPMLDPHVQLGLGVDWSHLVDNNTAVTQTGSGSGGFTPTRQLQISRASTNLFPIMAFAQFSGDDDMPIVPFFGAGGGYEVLNLSGDDFQNNTSFDATYGGWGWQVWGGAALPLSGQVRLTGEVFINTAEPGRDVTDDQTGLTYRETVKTNGAGMRLGMAWGF